MSENNYILGISAYYHDSAACLIKNGQIVAAAQEERFSRKKQDARLPINAIEYCLNEAQIVIEDVDYLGFYENSRLKFKRLLFTYLSFIPKSCNLFLDSISVWLRYKLFIEKSIKKQLGYSGKAFCCEHHESHAASAFYPSPFEDAAILTIDGTGEWATTAIGYGKGNHFSISREIRFPHSLGLLYSAFTYYCGFKVNSGEYKLMGLSPYGDPVYKDKVYELIDVKEDGSFKLDMSYFSYCTEKTMLSDKFINHFGQPPRKSDGELTQFYKDVASSIQRVTEEVMVKMANCAHSITGSDNLVLAGGVALNCVANSKVIKESPFKNIWIQPAAGDAGGALGIALYIWHNIMKKNRKPHDEYQQRSLLGPKYSNDDILKVLENNGASFDLIKDEDRLLSIVAGLIDEGKIIGWFQNRMEFGPRALGSRSIIGDARNSEMQTTMNLKIKFRESFRPFAPSVLEEYAHEYFDVDGIGNSPYMLLVSQVKDDKSIHLSKEQARSLKSKRSVIPAITHVDYSARLQTVNPQFGRYYKLIRAFYERTGCPVIINTSFNVRGEPIVCSPEEAFSCFVNTDIDVLVLENYILYKERQPDKYHISNAQRMEHLSQFELD